MLAIENIDREYLAFEAMRELAERHLKDFIKQAWHLMEPAAPFVDGWHIDAICEHLEAVSNAQIKRLLINIPPRYGKSLLVSVFWPCWEWINHAEIRWLFASYAEALSIRDSLKCRRLIQSAWYQYNWAHKFKITGDQNAKQRFETDKSGYRLATSVEGMITGEGGDRIIVDDPHNVKEALSDVKRANVLTWWNHAMSTRLNDPKTGAIVIIMQRVHEGDLSGHVLEQGGYEHLCLPAEYEVEDRSTRWNDPRKTFGDLLWPAKYGQPEIEELKKKLGSYAAAGQLQQRPSPLGGGLVNIDWFKRYNPEIPPYGNDVMMTIQAWDTAQKDDEILNAPWVCGTWIITYTNYYLVDVYREWMNYPTGKRAIKNLAAKWNPNAIVIEDKSTGSSLLQEVEGLPLIPFEPERDKVTRLSVESPIIEAGLVYIPDVAPWMADFEDEIRNFPNSVTKDQADMLSMSLKYLREKAGLFGQGIAGHGQTASSGADW